MRKTGFNTLSMLACDLNKRRYDGSGDIAPNDLIGWNLISGDENRVELKVVPTIYPTQSLLMKTYGNYHLNFDFEFLSVNEKGSNA